MKIKFYICAMLFLSGSVNNSVYAQSPAYGIVATCFYCGSSGPNAFNFRIYLWSADTSYFEYSGGQYCFEVDTSIANGGNLTYQIISSDLPENLRPRNPSVIRNGSYFILNLQRNEFPDPGNGYNLTRRAVYVADMRVTTTAPTIDTPFESMNWRNLSHPDYSTKIFANVNIINTEITTPDKHYMDFMFPVELSYFTSVVNRNFITLNWSTTNEVNNSGFDIERSVINGQLFSNWKKVYFVEGNGTTTLSKYYSFTDRNLNTGTYRYRLKQIDFNGNSEFFNLTSDVNVGIPTDCSLSQNYPNPFNPTTKIDYDIPTNGKVSLILYDLSGREMSTLVNEIKTAGYYSVTFDADNLSSGIYFYRISSKDFVMTKKMMILK
ncbi:MAG: T9SS type A sorting domain-containing protein [Ignavibacteria bacterium]